MTETDRELLAPLVDHGGRYTYARVWRERPETFDRTVARLRALELERVVRIVGEPSVDAAAPRHYRSVHAVLTTAGATALGLH